VLDVKKLLGVAVLATAFSGWMAANHACAQGNRGNSQTPYQVVLLDLDKLQIENPRLKLGMEQLNQEAQGLEVEFKKEDEALKEMYASLKQLKPGTPDYDSLDSRIMKRTAELRADLAKRQKELVKKQWKLRYSIFQEIREEVEAFASRNQIAAVIRFNSDQPDVENPQSIQRDLINKNVVWYDASLDITPDIKKALDRRHEKLTDQRSGFPAPQRDRR
jgi:Skp family chaperone for outer membrane proteins